MPAMPKPPETRRRRNAAPAFADLPMSGRQGRSPAWPLSVKPSAAVRKLWSELWKSPQAIVWEEQRAMRRVARYALLCIQAEQPEAKSYVLAETRQLENDLGLLPKSMRTMGWRIVDDQPEQTSDSTVAAMDDYRRMMQKRA